MLNARDNYLGVRYATELEKKDFEFVENLITKFTDEFFNKFLEIVSDVVYTYEPAEIHKAYNRAYYYAKKFGCKVSTFVNWYCIED